MKPKIYALPGLAGDHRLFQEFRFFHADLSVIEWERPGSYDWTFDDYAENIARDLEPDSYLMGISLGGIMAQKIAQYYQPKQTFLISTLLNHQELPSLLYGLKNIKLHEWISWKQVKKVPKAIVPMLEGKSQRELIPQMLTDSDAEFNDWAISRVLSRSTSEPISSYQTIHGTKDIVFPLGKSDVNLAVPHGNHFMALGYGAMISAWIDQQIAIIEAP